LFLLAYYYDITEGYSFLLFFGFINVFLYLSQFCRDIHLATAKRGCQKCLTFKIINVIIKKINSIEQFRGAPFMSKTLEKTGFDESR
jgi:hypothetical protein